jgi:hypothetical protein
MSGSVDDLMRKVDRALSDHADAERATRRVEILTGLEGELQSIAAGLDQATSAFAALDEVGAPADRPDTRSLVIACREAAGQLRREKSRPADLTRSLKDVGDVASTASATAKDAWREYVDQRMPGLAGLNSLADTLGQLRADRTQVAALKKGVADLQALTRKVPDSDAPRKAALAVQAVRTALTALVGDDSGGDDEVRHFIEAAAQGGAHVGALSQTVREWMRRSGTEQSFKIVPGRPVSG